MADTHHITFTTKDADSSRSAEQHRYQVPEHLPHPERKPCLRVTFITSFTTAKRTGGRGRVNTSCQISCGCLVAKSGPTLCDPMDCSLPDSSVRGIFQARILEWLPFPSPGVLPDPAIEPTSPASAGRSCTAEPPEKPSAAAAKSLQSCPTLCDPIDGSPPGSPVPGILQARTLEWVAISFSRGSSRPSN